MLKYFATCPKGIENLLLQELTGLGASEVKETVAGVYFSGDMNLGVKCCLWSRFATRILLIITTYHADTDINLYSGAFAIRYESYFSANETIAVSFNGMNDFIRNTQYGALRIKDAICDHFMSTTAKKRPNVDRDNPDVRINVHLDRKNNVTITLDLSGKPLHQREYRTVQGIAPLKENLAAAIIARAGYTSGNVIDPMCGAGTLLVEAAMKAANIAPGLFRHQYGFNKLKMFDPAVFAELKQQAKLEAESGVQRLKAANISFYGFDIDADVCAKARENAQRAGVGELVTIVNSELKELTNPMRDRVPGLVVCNPPYGERLGNFAELIEVYTLLGDTVKREFPQWRFAVISSSTDLLSCLRLRYENKYRLFNGTLDCQLRTFTITEQNTSSTEANSVNVAPISNEKTLAVAPEFANRLAKNMKHLDKWAKKEGITAYRVYDADIPNYAAAIDRYGDYFVIAEYAAPKSVPANIARQRLLDMVQVVVGLTHVPGDHVILKVRERKKGDTQYEKLDQTKHTMLIEEYGASFIVNLWDYLDTGLFLDHRLIRKFIAQNVQGKDFLNVFAYTGTATVHAALGEAKTTTTVDMSRTYLNWAKDNMLANDIKLHGTRHRFLQEDCLAWLDSTKEKFDFIFADPPTFSNSKRMNNTFDVQRDHVMLLGKLARLLKPNGQLIFSNNKRNFKIDLEQVEALGLTVQDMTAQTIAQDFKHNPKIHNCYLLTKVVDNAQPKVWQRSSTQLSLKKNQDNIDAVMAKAHQLAKK